MLPIASIRERLAVVTAEIQAGATINLKNVLRTNKIGHRLCWEYWKIGGLNKHWVKKKIKM